MDITQLLAFSVKNKASDLHLSAGLPPMIRVHGDVRRINCIAALPLYHIFALTLCLLSIRWGAHMTLIPNPRDFGRFVATLKKRPFHVLPAVNTLFNALLQHPDLSLIHI